MIFKYFLIVCALSFLSLNSIFHIEKNFNFEKVHFIDFSQVDLVFSVVSKNILPNSGSCRFFPRAFIVLCFPFRSVIHFELIFYIGYEVCVEVYSFAYGYTIVVAPFVEKTPFFMESFCQNSMEHT